MDLLYLLYSLLRKKWIILGCTVAGVIASLIFFMFRPNDYVSLAQYSTGFTMEQKVKIKDVEGFNIYEIDIRFSNVAVAFASDKVLGTLGYTLLLHDLEDPKPFRKPKSLEKRSVDLFTAENKEKVKQTLRSKINSLELLSAFVPDEKLAIDMMEVYGYNAESLMNQLSLERVGRTDFINIFANSEDPFLSAFMANQSGTQLIRFFDQIYGQRTVSASTKLQDLVAEKGNAVDSLNKKLVEFKKKVGTITGEAKGTAAMAVIQELVGKDQEETSRLNKLRGEKIAVDKQLAEIAADNSSVSTTSSNNREIKRLQDKNLELDKQLEGKTDEEKKTIRDEMDANTNKIVQLSSGSRTTGTGVSDRERRNTKRDALISRKIELEQEIIASETTLEQFRKEKLVYQKMTTQGGGDEFVLAEYQRNLEIASKEWEGLRSSLQGSRDLDLNPQNNFKQTLMGMPAGKPSPSRKLIVSGLAGFLMMFFSSLTILLLEFIDSSYKTPTMFQRVTKLKLLSSINNLNLKNKSIEQIIQQPVMNVKLGSPEQVFVESIRRLRFELENSEKRVFLVTSTRPKEGKSTIIESLAHSLSLSKKRILIIDANFSNNTLSEKFGAKPVLEQFSVNGQSNALEKILSSTQATIIPNTEIIGCGEGNYTPSEVLPKNNLFESFEKILGRYDFVFIETASLNHHPDAKELSRYADGIIAVIAATSSNAQADKDSIEFLKSTGPKLVGAVFNRVQKENIDL